MPKKLVSDEQYLKIINKRLKIFVSDLEAYFITDMMNKGYGFDWSRKKTKALIAKSLK